MCAVGVAVGQAVNTGDVLVVIASGGGTAGAAIEFKGANAVVYWLCTCSMSRVARRLERRVA